MRIEEKIARGWNVPLSAAVGPYALHTRERFGREPRWSLAIECSIEIATKCLLEKAASGREGSWCARLHFTIELAPMLEVRWGVDRDGDRGARDACSEQKVGDV